MTSVFASAFAYRTTAGLAILGQLDSDDNSGRVLISASSNCGIRLKKAPKPLSLTLTGEVKLDPIFAAFYPLDTAVNLFNPISATIDTEKPEAPVDTIVVVLTARDVLSSIDTKRSEAAIVLAGACARQLYTRLSLEKKFCRPLDLLSGEALLKRHLRDFKLTDAPKKASVTMTPRAFSEMSAQMQAAEQERAILNQQH